MELGRRTVARIDRDQLGLLLASAWALRGTCGRRQVGCVLFDGNGQLLASGYNGPASGESHCRDTGGLLDHACPGVGLPSGEGLDRCEALHSEANALMRCRDVGEIRVAYVTHSPCIHCVKLLMNTGCQRIVFREPYAHDEVARALWLNSLSLQRYQRTWEQVLQRTYPVNPYLGVPEQLKGKQL